MLDDMLNYFDQANSHVVYSTSELATAIRSIATYFLVYIYNLFAPSLTPPTAVWSPQAAIILEF